MTTFKVFLADDHAIVREGIKSLVTAQPDMTVVGEAADRLAAVGSRGPVAAGCRIARSFPARPERD